MKSWMTWMVSGMLAWGTLARGEATVTNVFARQRYPWNGLVDISCTVEGIEGEAEGLKFSVAAVEESGKVRWGAHVRVVRDGVESDDLEARENREYELVWDARADLGTGLWSNVVVRVTLDAHNGVQLWEGGPFWAETNIGAEEPWEYGQYFWWGDTVGYKREGSAWVASDGSSENFSFSTGDTPTQDKNNPTLQSEGWITAEGVLAPEHDAAQVQWGGGWRMPTDREFSALVSNCDWTWTATNGVNGQLVRGKGDFSEASIFLPAAGRGSGTSLSDAGASGYIWSSVPYASDSGRAWRLNFHSGGPNVDYRSGRGWGRSVRPLRGAAVCERGSALMVLDTREGTRIVSEGVAENIALSGRWYGAAATVTADGEVLDMAEAGEEKTVKWTPDGTGLYVLQLVSGGKTLEAAFTVLGDDVVLHEGEVSRSETWAADKVHLVTAAVTVGSESSLIIESGSVVKFMDGTGLTVASGGSCTAYGVVFTHVADDSAGGDTMMDGAASVPAMGGYTLSGNILEDEATEERYAAPVVLSGTLSYDMRLQGHKVYTAVGNITIASGVTVTIAPGAIIKMGSGLSVTVASGATLVAQGTRAEPIVCTSVKDDEHGGDTNGDGDATSPQAGDWYQIRVQGTAIMDHCSVLYASSAENYGGVEAYGGTVAFDNGEIAFMKYDSVNAHSSGTFTARNSVIREGSLGFGYYGSGRVKAFNCVFHGLTTAVRQSGKELVNCVFSECQAFTDQGGDGSTFRNCVFWNPPGYGAQSYSKVGSNGNKWGDPLFVDAENGDFRVAEGSPCVDAGDTAVAPETDLYGQPRVSAFGEAVADIGVYEVQPRGVAGDVDLVPVKVSADAAVTPGGKLTVKWTVGNRGGKVADTARRDTVSLVSANGRTVALGDVVVSRSVAAGGTCECSGNFTVPAMAEGTWYPKVVVNSYQDVFEGSLVANNALTGAEGVEVSVAVTDPATGASGTVTAGVPMVLKLGFGAGDENRMVILNVPAGVSVSWGFGFVPMATEGTDSASGTAVAEEVGTVAFLVPEGEGEVYVVLESETAAEWSLRADSSRLAVTAAEPATLPSSGLATVAVLGGGFTPSTAVSFAGKREVAPESVAYVSAGRLLATVDCGKLGAGTRWNVVLKDGTASARLEGAVSVQAAPPEPKLAFSIETPPVVRPGRMTTGFVEWKNEGNAEALAPVITLKASKGTRLSLEKDGEFKRSIVFVGIGEVAPSGKIMPGQGGRQYFHFVPGNGPYKISYSVLGLDCEIERDSVFATWKEFAEGISSAATRMGLAGFATVDFMRLRDLANKAALGFPDAIVTGRLFNELAGRPMAGRRVVLKDSGGRTLDSAATGEDGSFAFFDVRRSKGLSLETEDVGGTADTSVDTSAGDCLGVEIRSAVRPIGGTVVSPAREPQAGAAVELWADGEKLDSAVTDGRGEFVFWGVTNGNCVLAVPAYGVCGRAEANIGGDAYWGEIVLPWAARVEGRVSFANGDVPPEGIPVMLVATEGGEGAAAYATTTDAEGRFGFSGLLAGDYQLASLRRYALSFAEVEATATVGEAVSADVSVPGPVPFEADMPVCFAPGSVSFAIDDEAVLAARAFRWDFDADGVADSSEAAPVHTYETPGIYEVVLQAQREDGEWKEYRYPECVKVRESVETVLNTNVRALPAESVLSFDASAGGMVVAREAGAEFQPGDVLVVPSQEGTSVVKVRAVAERQDGTVLEVEAAEVTDVFKSVSGVVPKGAVGEWVVGKLVELLPELGNSCLGGSFDYSLDLPIPASPCVITITPGVEGAMALEVYDGKIVLGHIQAGTSIKAAIDLDFNAGAEVSIPLKEKEIPLANFAAGPIPMTLNGKASIEGTLKAGWDGHWNYTTPTVRRGGYVEWGENSLPFPHNMGWLSPIKVPQSFSKPPLAVGFSATASIGMDVAAGFNIKAVKAKALAVGIKGGLTGTYERRLMDDFSSDEGQFSLEFGPSLTFTPFEAEIWKASVAVAPQTLPLGDSWKHEFQPSYSAIPAIVSANIDSEGNAVIGAKVNWKDTGECGYTENVDWGDGSAPDVSQPGVHTHKYDMKGFQDRVEMTVVVTQDYDSLLSRTKKAAKTLVLNPQPCRCGANCDECEGNCGEDCQSGSGGDGGPTGNSGGKDVISNDPNEMAGPLGAGAARYVAPGTWMTYTVYFENKSTATAAAQEVYVTEQLSGALDWSTFEVVDVGFNNQIDLGLGGKRRGASETGMTGTAYKVRTDLDFDEKTGTAKWYMRIVDERTETRWPKDVFAGFLPPNDETGRGEGHITYRVKVRDDAAAGTVVRASASIVFDYNAAIETDPAWWNTVAEMGEATVDLGNGGSTNVTVMVGAPWGGQLPDPGKRQGMRFGGWFTGPDGTGEEVTAETLVEAGATLYAFWDASAAPELWLDVSWGAVEIGTNGVVKGYAPDGSGVDGSANRYVLTGTSTVHGVKFAGGSFTNTWTNLFVKLGAKDALAVALEGASVEVELAGDNEVSSGEDCAGIRVDEKSVLMLDGEGRLTATGGAYGAGIGGGLEQKSGRVEIRGGTVEAKGGDFGAGIGGGLVGPGAEVVITGGSVKARGDRGTDIGNGYGEAAGGAPKDAVGGLVHEVEVPFAANALPVTAVVDLGGGRTYRYTGMGHRDDTSLWFWLPDGTYDFEADGEDYGAHVAGAKTVAVFTDPGNAHFAAQEPVLAVAEPTAEGWRMGLSPAYRTTPFKLWTATEVKNRDWDWEKVDQASYRVDAETGAVEWTGPRKTGLRVFKFEFDAKEGGGGAAREAAAKEKREP